MVLLTKAYQLALAIFAASAVVPLHTAIAATISYTNRTVFVGTLGSSIADTYETGYEHGNKSDTAFTDRFDNAGMNSVLGETQYVTTGIANWNLVLTSAGNRLYCAGCNGSFQLSFTNTSLSKPGGIYGFGIDYWNAKKPDPNFVEAEYVAFVQFADGSYANYSLGQNPFSSTATPLFFGLTSDILISSVAFGLADGTPTGGGQFVMDNLTIGTSPSTVPLPAALPLFGTVLAGGGLIAWRRRRKAEMRAA